MSHYLNIETNITDAKALVRALQRVELRGTHKCATVEQIEVHEKAAHLYGYHGDKREDKAHVIIRREFVGDYSNDIGFYKDKDGKFRAIISDFDRGNYYNKDWQKKLFTYYGVEKAKMECERRRLPYKEFVNPEDPQKRPQLLVEVQ